MCHPDQFLKRFAPSDKGEVGREGLEPSTNGLKGHCSTIELPTRESAKQSLRLFDVNAFLYGRREREINDWGPGKA